MGSIGKANHCGNAPLPMSHFVYILWCADNTFYTGYTTNVEKRCVVHNKGKGAKYTRCRLPVCVVYSEEFESKSAALKREYQIKQLTRKQKQQLCKTWTPK
jgi:putative endonuclease